MSGGNQVGQISGQARGDADRLTGLSIEAMANRYKQLGLGGVGAQPSGPTSGATPGIPGSGTTPTTPGTFATGGGTPGGTTGGTPAFGGFGHTVSEIQPGGAPAATPFSGGPTGFEMDIGQAPSWTGGIPQEFQAALGEAQFQDLGQTTSAAVGSQQAKGQTLSGIGQLGGLFGGI